MKTLSQEFLVCRIRGTISPPPAPKSLVREQVILRQDTRVGVRAGQDPISVNFMVSCLFVRRSGGLKLAPLENGAGIQSRDDAGLSSLLDPGFRP